LKFCFISIHTKAIKTNQFFLLKRKNSSQRPIAKLLALMLGIELASSVTLPTASLMVIYQTLTEMSVSSPIVVSFILIWSSALVVSSLMGKNLETMYWWYHGR
jgi:hypothetical protein